jgi:hypothetical protein
MISTPTLLKLAKAMFTAVPTEVETLYAASCCDRTAVLQVAPNACSQCRKRVTSYLCVSRQGEVTEVHAETKLGLQP